MKGWVEYVPAPISHPACSRPHNATGAVGDREPAAEPAGVNPVVVNGVAAAGAEEPAGDAAGAHADATKSDTTAATTLWALMDPFPFDSSAVDSALRPERR